MADVDIKKSSNQSSESERQALQHQGRMPLSRSRGWDPFFSFTPAEFFSSSPFALMRRMSEEMDRVFGQSGGQSAGQNMWYPPIEVAEQNGRLEVRADLPGIKPEDVKVEITGDSLTIRGERKYEHEQQTGRFHRSERRYGEFYREIALPEGANTEQAKAEFRDGVLQVTVPVPEQAGRRREIPISSDQPGASKAASASQGGTRSTNR
ncbi:MAG: Hsp20/alpha crystallin family protein [Bryobacteraceae bacterium]